MNTPENPSARKLLAPPSLELPRVGSIVYLGTRNSFGAEVNLDYNHRAVDGNNLIFDATLAANFEGQARRLGPRVFLKHKQQKAWRDHSWTEIADRAMRLRTGLLRLGVRPGNRIAILAENSPEWVIVDQALLGLGAVVVPLYTTSGVDEMRHVIADSGARLVAAGNDALIEKVRGLGTLSSIEAIIAMHDGAHGQDGALPVLTLDSLRAFDPTTASSGARDDLATLIYTSGTTGASKGVMLTHGNLLANSESNLDALKLGEQDMTLSFLPVAHSFERTAGHYTVIAGGGTIAYAEGLGQIAQNLLEVEPTILLTVPRLLEVVYSRIMRTIESAPRLRQSIFRAASAVGARAADLRQRGQSLPPWMATTTAMFDRLVYGKIKRLFGSRLRYLISGGAPLPLEINRFFAAMGLPIVEGYGLTEAAPVVAVNLHGHTRIGSVGRALKNIEVRAAADGELLVRGPNVMRGYFGREADTRDAIDAEGWLHTGDIGQIDGEGYIRITDRKKEIIVLSGGKNVSPANLESKLAADPYIAQACVIGDRRKHLAAILVPNFENLAGEPLRKLQRDGKSLGEIAAAPALRDFFHQRLREFNRPLSDVEAIVDFRLTSTPFSQENGELTPTMKIRRRVVQQHYRAEIESMYGG